MTKRWWFLAVLAMFVIGSILARATWLQVVHGAAWREKAEGNRVTVREIPAPRGLIKDINGELLAENVASTDLVINPILLPREDEEGILIENLLNLTELSINEIREGMTKARETQREVTILKALEHEQVVTIEDNLEILPGVVLTPSLVRRYPKGHLTAHTIGYNDKTGLEKYYDEILRGEDGTQYQETTAQGRLLRELTNEPPKPGQDVTLNIDIELTSMIHNLFNEKEKTGAVIVMNPKTGAVNALYSHPTFDSNIFSQPKLSDQVQNILKDEAQPLFSRATSGKFPPGSTIKPLVAAASLEEDIVTANTSFFSTGGINIGPWSFPDWKAGGHGATNVYKAIAESVNTFFYLVAGGDETRTGLGVERLTDYLARFGWGQPTGIDLPDEAAGFLPSEEWKEEVKEEPWYIGDTYHLAIGQGDVLVTPLQVAVATATIANAGRMPRPHLLQTEEVPEPTTIDISQANMEVVRAAMHETVVGSSGSGRSLQALPIDLAGKTGTAQTGREDETHAWFTSFGPYADPDLVVTVLLEKGGAGDKDAVPVAREIWQWWHDHRVSKTDDKV